VTTYIGIDGGGSTTRMMVRHGDDRSSPGDDRSSPGDDRSSPNGAAPEYYEIPVSLKVRDGDYASSAARLKEVLRSPPAPTLGMISGTEITASAQRRRVPRHDLKHSALSIAIGLSGMSRAEDQASLAAAIHAIPAMRDARLHIESDATLTLKAAIPNGEPGILLIAGTGSVIYYRTADGDVRRIGGWGPILSDEGSGYRIGLRALRRYMGVLDGVYPGAALSSAIAARLAATLSPQERDDRSAIARLVLRDPAFVASLARDVFEAAETLPGVRDLIHEEMVDLFTSLSSIVFSGVMGSSRPYTLYLSGSIAKHPITQEAIRMSFEESDLALVLVDDLAPCAKALEIARNNDK
jgi:N-acetylglucosamine kinase-like BadF-type ATPase